MDKEEYLRLLRQASIADTSKFTPIDPNRPKTRRRLSKHFHPLLQKEKVESIFHQVLPEKLVFRVYVPFKQRSEVVVLSLSLQSNGW